MQSLVIFCETSLFRLDINCSCILLPNFTKSLISINRNYNQLTKILKHGLIATILPIERRKIVIQSLI
ncbi:unnamed protein product [Paramecium primaurelia]|uniref:Uncharacterized protein n=1 Tax=Paramecium primaurelia TaxID=5886 RepID=A0A8S1MG72_PARPR|nr:unnamed protein product [Paramecium primaurelia]